MELKLLYREVMKGDGNKDENNTLETLNENESSILLYELQGSKSNQ